MKEVYDRNLSEPTRHTDGVDTGVVVSENPDRFLAYIACASVNPTDSMLKGAVQETAGKSFSLQADYQDTITQQDLDADLQKEDAKLDMDASNFALEAKRANNPDAGIKELDLFWDAYHKRFYKAVKDLSTTGLQTPDSADFNQAASNLEHKIPCGAEVSFLCRVGRDNSIKSMKVVSSDANLKALMEKVLSEQINGQSWLKFHRLSKREFVDEWGTFNVVLGAKDNKADDTTPNRHDVEKITVPSPPQSGEQ